MPLQNLGLLLLLSSILLSGAFKLLSLLSSSPTSFPENPDFLRKSLSPALPCHLLILCMGLTELLLPLPSSPRLAGGKLGEWCWQGM
eukprot:CAMPEP_0168344326 /NCGR_PEP_ID=MMETSP0213-20121227/16747_1 /TAXON_ID=151035 /ORGANISM="Euplotes harpa, Strain FSP1.4" /LENGTH=86 /DNA_ID=CAMNT_0008352041 /DNA_START=24 /DNA_END=284 /DNA_ORIENTATION=+